MMGIPTPASRKNGFIRLLQDLTPTARLGVIIFLLALAMVAVGLGIRSATQGFSPIRSNEPSLMVEAVEIMPFDQKLSTET